MTVSTLIPVSPAEVHGILGRHILPDGYNLVFDFERSRGAWVHDSRGGRDYLDFCTFFGSNPIGYNHPKMKDPEFLDVLHRVAQLKPALSDLYSVEYAWFVDVFGRGVAGGQFADGSQKDGFLKYEKGRPAAIYSPESGSYVALSEVGPRCDERLGPPPASLQPWKGVISKPDKAVFLEGYFRELRGLSTLGAELARTYGKRAKEIGLGLVKDGVARREEDVNTVMLTGFYHAYGPINGYFD